MAQSGACVSCDAASSASAATSIADLPDDALARCLGFLELKERLCSAALVSKRFAAAACSPEPLREVDVTMTAAGMPSFVLWLARHGRHMRRFNCAANPLASRAEHAAAAGALTACLSAVGAAGRLQDLELKYCVASTAWLAATRSLRRLEIFSNSHHAVLLSPTISRLTQLEVLSVSGLERFTPDVRLPESITWLQVSDGSETMPAQIALLPNLKRLELSFCHYSSDSMGALTTLVGSLTRLKLASGILACLPELTQLQNLEWSAYGAGALEAASQALQRLTKLTCLDLAGIGSIPAALGSLPRLQRLALQDVGNAALPSGRMLRSLRWLGAPIDVLLDSTQLLREAGALEYVAVLDCSGNGIDWDSPAMAAFWDWLASHPPLRRLSIDAAWGEDSECDWYEILMRVLQLWRCRPSLAVSGPGFGDQGSTKYQQLEADE